MKASERSLYQILCILLTVIILCQYCSRPKKTPCPEIIRTERDTTINTHQDSVSKHNPQPTAVIPSLANKPVKPKVVTLIDTFYVIDPVDTAAILRDYNAQYIYQDSVSLQYGSVYLTDTVSQNSITGRSVKTKFDIPTIRETTVVAAKPKGQLFVGAGVLGTQTKPISLVGPEAVFKTKTDRMYSAGVYLGSSRFLTYRAGILIKL